LPHLSKLIELVITTRFAELSATYNLLPVQPSAYRPFHSTETAIASVFNHLVLSVDNGKVSLVIVLDLSAAFDTVDHQLLLSVLAERFSINSPNSPDLILVYHKTWSVVKQRVYQSWRHNVDELK